MIKRRPSCFDCKHASIDGGSPGGLYEPPEPAWAECQLPECEELQEEHGDNAAPHCPHFQPEMVESCYNCKAEINQPAWSWQLFVPTEGEPCYVCSEACQTALGDRFREQEESEAAIVRKYEERERSGLLDCHPYSDGEVDEHLADQAFDADREQRYFGKR